MGTVKLKISARELDPNVKYIPFRYEPTAQPFFPDTTPKEVNVPQNKWNPEFAWKVAGFVLMSALTIVEPAFANGIDTETMQTAKEIDQIFSLFTKLLVLVGVGSAGVLLSAAGLYRMIRKEKEAKEWSTDIIKGLVQVLLAGPTVMLLVYIATLLFGSSSWFVAPLFR